MRTLCIYTEQHPDSVRIAKECVRTGKAHGVSVELWPAVWYEDMHVVHRHYGLKCKYEPVRGSNHNYEERTLPRTRIANGTTHYLLYKWSVYSDQALHILEHDAFFVGKPPPFVGKPPPSIYDGVIQTSSHTVFQMTPDLLWDSMRAQKQRKHEPEREYDRRWDRQSGVIPHPLSGTSGTSGYVIGPGAAARMVEYIESDGIANADRIRAAHIGEGNLYLQCPQSVFCSHNVKSHCL
jgi:hypothetical protein